METDLRPNLETKKTKSPLVESTFSDTHTQVYILEIINVFLYKKGSCNINKKCSILNHIRSKEVKPDPKTFPN